MFKPNTTILFQGDSITDGGRNREDCPNHGLGHGYVYLIAARLGAEYPEDALTFRNRGCSGDKVTDLATRWEEDTLRLAPDVLSILIGVNGVGANLQRSAGVPHTRYEAVYRELVEKTVQALPDIRLVLCEPFVLPGSATRAKWDTWRAEIDLRRQVVQRLAREFGAVFVPTQQTFETASQTTGPEYWIWDGVHPTPAGHELLARTWLAAVGNGRKRQYTSSYT